MRSAPTAYARRRALQSQIGSEDLDRNDQGTRIVDECCLPDPSASMLDLSTAEAIVDVKDAAEYAGLAYVSDEKPGIRRKRSGKGFRYQTAQGSKVRDEAILKRIKS